MPPSVLPALSLQKSARATRVLVVDDHPGFRLGVVEMLHDIDGFEVCGEAGDSTTAIASFRDLEPDLVVMDISLPGRDGIEVTKMMLAERPHTTVLVLTMHDELFYGLRALKAGAYGYLRKDDTLTQLADAVRHTANRTHYVSPRLLAQLINKLAHTPTVDEEGKPAIQGLSDREMEVFHWLAKGLGTRQIATQLCLSIKTIETHRAHIKSKLRMPTAQSIVKLAREWHELDERSSSLKRNGSCQQAADRQGLRTGHS
ncbi:response regulator transcription factor [Verrucomicrobium spinosum]|uniref:response regulator transcription factor n=1 Tax=Verrucomicrobium spinosum TaxID=2736 RepID=UPI001C436C04|nr:response regulator transcription factor [Verrucomicrobium spinosum]